MHLADEILMTLGYDFLRAPEMRKAVAEAVDAALLTATEFDVRRAATTPAVMDGGGSGTLKARRAIAAINSLVNPVDVRRDSRPPGMVDALAEARRVLAAAG